MTDKTCEYNESCGFDFCLAMDCKSYVRKMKPIIFNSSMVRAILDGSKMQTRRIVKPQPRTYSNQMWDYIKPPYQVSDVLWVRETWCTHEDINDNAFDEALIPGYYYKVADDGKIPWFNNCKDVIYRWRPSIHMPREAARIFLKVKSIRIEQLQEITPRDAWEEGCRIGNSFPWEEHIPELQQQCRDIVFKGLWNSIYDNWDDNPWVWRIEFERVEG
jgi:hypothetical protein